LVENRDFFLIHPCIR